MPLNILECFGQKACQHDSVYAENLCSTCMLFSFH